MSRPWMHLARCREVDPEMFFPEKGRTDIAKEGKRICAGCEVQAECLAHVVANPAAGTWGGLSEGERRNRGLSIDPVRVELEDRHGTEAGYQRHLRAQEQPCDRCQIAVSYLRRERELRRDSGAA